MTLRACLGVALLVSSGCGGPAPSSPSTGRISTEAAEAPLAIGGRCTAPSLATGDNHTCMVRPGGAVVCWGSNASQQLGSATPTFLATPTEVAGVTGAVAVAAGASHTCALRSDGTVTCWGANSSGQLGDGTIARYGAPTAVSGLTGITSIALGALHSCALRNDGTVWCWGSNGSGRLGDGTTVRRPTPVRVQSLTNVQAITAGGTFSCALTSAGVAYCWGANGTGQLGDGTRASRLRPVEVHAGHGELWRSLAAGPSHVCGVLQQAGNEVRCWGSNNARQLGFPNLVRYETAPGAVLEPSGEPLRDAVMVSAGGSTSCAIRGDGRAACWGANSQGQLGVGALSSTPQEPADVHAMAPLAGAFLLVSSGRSHTCAVAVSGEAFCFGSNAVGQLGDGTRTRRTTPVRAGGSDAALTFGAFAAEDDLSALHGAEATSLVSAGDVLLAAGVEHAAIDRWTVRRSRDHGANWTTLATFEDDGALQAPHLARLPAGTLFLAGAAAADGDTAWLVRRSADGGDTWTDVDTFVFERGHAAALRALASDQTGRLFAAGTAEGASGAHWLVRGSGDDGASWFVADDYAAEGATAHAVLDTTSGLFVAGHAVSGGSAHLRVRRATSISATDHGTTWTDADDFQDEAGFDTFGEALATDLGGRVFVLARANGAAGWHLVLRVSTDGATFQTASRLQLQGADTEGFGLLADRAGTLHVVGRAGGRGLVASSYDHGATWVVADQVGSAGSLTALVEDPTGAIHAAGVIGSGDAARWTVLSRACHGIAPSCGNWIIDPGELCDGNCADCDDHDACTADATAGAATTCNVVCTNTPISACTSGDGCCPAGCTSADDLDCCTGPIENGACVDESFQLDTLSDSSCAVLEHSPVNGTSRGALAVSSANVFYTATRANRAVMGRFSATDLTGGRATSYAWSSLFSDLRTGTVYVLGSGAIASAGLSGRVSTLIPLDPQTGALAQPRITLSQPITMSATRAFFSGYGRLLLYNGARLYDVQLPSGQVTDLGSMILPPHNTCSDRGAWGLAESFGGALYIDYVYGDQIQRMHVPGGAPTTLKTFTSLGASCAIGFSTSARRWYFETSGASQFAPSGTATLGACAATFRRPNATPVCNDGVLEARETCEGDCPTSCDDGVACTADVMTGSPATCDAVCGHTPITSCAHGDGCCVAGCNHNDDDDCAPACGNGVVEAGEACDGDCPASCNDNNACTTDTLTGSAGACSATCGHAPVTSCVNGDGCCPSGCNANNDHDCAPVCGNGVVEAGEACDGSCPASCNDNNACTTDTLTGSAGACSATCGHATVTACTNGDGCCPSGCNANNDHDCAPICGNGVVEAGEACDGSCPTSCTDGDACTTDTLTGTAGACSATCSHATVTACTSGDGCCPSGCTHANDTDCTGGCEAVAPNDAAHPAAGCVALREAGQWRSGLYWIDPNGGSTSDAFQAWCDMDTDGGGWTLVAVIRSATTFAGGNAIWHSAGTATGLTPSGAEGVSLAWQSVSATQISFHMASETWGNWASFDLPSAQSIANLVGSTNLSAVTSGTYRATITPRGRGFTANTCFDQPWRVTWRDYWSSDSNWDSAIFAPSGASSARPCGGATSYATGIGVRTDSYDGFAGYGGSFEGYGADTNGAAGLTSGQLNIYARERTPSSTAAGACTLPRACSEVASTTSGFYTIDPSGGDESDAYSAWCDMTTAGGGWTLVMVTSDATAWAGGNAIWHTPGTAGGVGPTSTNGKSYAYADVAGYEYLIRTQSSASNAWAAFRTTARLSLLDLLGRDGLQAVATGSWRHYLAPIAQGSAAHACLASDWRAGAVNYYSSDAYTDSSELAPGAAWGARPCGGRTDYATGIGVRTDSLRSWTGYGGSFEGYGGDTGGNTGLTGGYVAIYVRQGTAMGSLPTSCAGVTGTTNGNYLVDPNGGSPDDAYLAYCDMTTDGGGWTLALATADGSAYAAGATTWHDATYVNGLNPSTEGKSVAYGSFTGTQVLFRFNHEAAGNWASFNLPATETLLDLVGTTNISAYATNTYHASITPSHQGSSALACLNQTWRVTWKNYWSGDSNWDSSIFAPSGASSGRPCGGNANYATGIGVRTDTNDGMTGFGGSSEGWGAETANGNRALTNGHMTIYVR